MVQPAMSQIANKQTQATARSLQVAGGGAEETPLPFSTTLDLGGAAAGDVVTIMVRGDSGIDADPGDFGAIPVVITG